MHDGRVGRLSTHTPLISVPAGIRTALLVPELPTLEALTLYLRRIDEKRWYSNFGPLVQEFETRFAASFANATSLGRKPTVRRTDVSLPTASVMSETS